MITAERKPMQELVECLKPYGRILLAGCNECVTVCAAGGRKEVALLASSLRMALLKEGKVLNITEITLERQCDPEYVEELVNHIDQVDAVLSMACGCGVQEVARRFRENLFFRQSTLGSWGLPSARGFGRNAARGAVIACLGGLEESAPLPGAPNAC